jgi:C-terminal processing protease CtpA/Prc
VQAYKLGEIIGGPTAGTNGTTNRFKTPGDYIVLFTGTKVLNHDGSQLHGVGISPTIEVAATRAGLAAGRDELIERARQLLSTP